MDGRSDGQSNMQIKGKSVRNLNSNSADPDQQLNRSLNHSEVTLDEIRSVEEGQLGKKFSQPASDFTLARDAEKDKRVKPDRGGDIVETGLVGPHEKSQAY